MDVDIVEKESLKLLGVDYYGPLESLRDEKSPIENLWDRFASFCSERWYAIEELVVNEDTSYEVHMWNQKELEESKNFMAFIGVEVKEFKRTPVELVGKLIPEGRYARVTLKGEEIENWEKLVYKEWLESSDYQVRLFGTYSLDYQVYDEKVFKGVDQLEDSELEVYVPIEEYIEV
ncbi:MAG: GyrI-like domain-containing protein [Candidatus Saliniplasma sp.]